MTKVRTKMRKGFPAETNFLNCFDGEFCGRNSITVTDNCGPTNSSEAKGQSAQSSALEQPARNKLFKIIQWPLC